MNKKPISTLQRVWFISTLIGLFALPAMVAAAQLTLQWDATDPVPQGYRLFQRQHGATFDYTAPVWTGTVTTRTIDGLIPGATYYFVVRAFGYSAESGDSNEVQYTPAVLAEPELDSDGDGWGDTVDAFPHNPLEWLDTDKDGLGNNADEDDDGDGMPDAWELLYGLNTLMDDAQDDLDGDGISNLNEYARDSDPSGVPGNSGPHKPVLSRPADGAQGVGLTPTLISEAFTDPDLDAHARTCYQISTTADFASLVLEWTSAQHLVSLRIPDLILDPETVYYWRVKFYDRRNGASEWSNSFRFETIDSRTAGDANSNGIIDAQEMDEASDIDGNGTVDVLQSGMQGVVTADPYNPVVAVKRASQYVQVVGMLALDIEELPLAANEPEHLTGVISFKLLLMNDAAKATVTVFFSQPAPANAKWLKFDMDEGWTVYNDALFSPDRRSVRLVLEDGGIGDQDGVRNGIIIDSSGLGYSSQTSSDPSTFNPDHADNSACFISNAASPAKATGAFVVLVLLAVFAQPLITLCFDRIGKE